MKMKQEHYDHIKKLIDQFIANHPNILTKYETGDIPRAELVEDLQTRFNFDMYHSIGGSVYSSDILYDYLDDSHIATALNNICPKVTRRY